MDSLQLTHCHKKQRVTIFKMPALSQSKGYYLDDWKEMLWEGGVKVTEKNKVLKVTFIDKANKVFAQTQIPPNYKEAIVKTQDSSRGYAVRLKKPTGGYLWIGVAFRDRNDAFDFGVVFQEYNQRNKLSLNPNALKEQFGKEVDFSLKKGEKIKININSNPKKGENSNFDFFNDFSLDDNKQTKKKQEKKEQKKSDGFDADWFGDFANNNTSTNTKKQQPKVNNNQKPNNDLIDLL